MYRTLLTCLLTTLCCAAEPATQPASRPASRPALTIQRRAELQKWITQLGDESYAVRKRAQGELERLAGVVMTIEPSRPITQVEIEAGRDWYLDDPEPVVKLHNLLSLPRKLKRLNNK